MTLAPSIPAANNPRGEQPPRRTTMLRPDPPLPTLVFAARLLYIERRIDNEEVIA